MSRKKKSLSVKIKDVEWTVYSQSNSAYIRQHGNDSGAITYTQDREVYFNKNSFLTDYVRHELMHMYVSSANVVSSSLTADQMEELICELYGEHGPEMDKLVDKIVNFVLKDK